MMERVVGWWIVYIVGEGLETLDLKSEMFGLILMESLSDCWSARKERAPLKVERVELLRLSPIWNGVSDRIYFW